MIGKVCYNLSFFQQMRTTYSENLVKSKWSLNSTLQKSHWIEERVFYKTMFVSDITYSVVASVSGQNLRNLPVLESVYEFLVHLLCCGFSCEQSPRNWESRYFWGSNFMVVCRILTVRKACLLYSHVQVWFRLYCWCWICRMWWYCKNKTFSEETIAILVLVVNQSGRYG